LLNCLWKLVLMKGKKENENLEFNDDYEFSFLLWGGI
jgi:hypothetical protein